MVLAISAAVGQSLALLPVPLLLAYLIDRVLPARDLPQVILVGGAVFAAHLVYTGLSLLTHYLILAADGDAVRLLRRDLIDQCAHLPRLVYSRADHARLHTHLTQDTERVAVMSGVLIDHFLPAALSTIALGLALVWIYPPVALVVIPVSGALYLSLRLLGGRLRASVRRFRQASENYSRGTRRLLQNLDLTRRMGVERHEREYQYGLVDDLRGASRRLAAFVANYNSAHGVVIGLSGALVLVAGGTGVIRGRLTAGHLLALYTGFSLLRGHVSTLLRTYPQLAVGHASLRALWELLQSAADEPYDGRRALQFRGDLRLEEVSFRYGDGFALRGVSLAVERGAEVALVGEIGAGKSTVTHLLLGLYRPEAGRVLADGIPLAELDLTHLRQQIGLVPQDPLIMPGTVAENIAYGYPATPAAEIERAARLAGIHDFIAGLPAGYETLVGERGARLSGGQRQRLAIARALLRRPALLILDEPTNHLDAPAVARLLRSFRELPHSPGILLISHDWEVVRAGARFVYLMRGGVIVARGTPEKVLAELSAAGQGEEAAAVGRPAPG